MRWSRIPKQIGELMCQVGHLSIQLHVCAEKKHKGSASDIGRSPVDMPSRLIHAGPDICSVEAFSSTQILTTPQPVSVNYPGAAPQHHSSNSDALTFKPAAEGPRFTEFLPENYGLHRRQHVVGLEQANDLEIIFVQRLCGKLSTLF